MCAVTHRDRRASVPRSWSYRQLKPAQQGCWDPNPDPLEEKNLLLTTEISSLTSSYHNIPDFEKSPCKTRYWETRTSDKN